MVALPAHVTHGLLHWLQYGLFCPPQTPPRKKPEGQEVRHAAQPRLDVGVPGVSTYVPVPHTVMALHAVLPAWFW